MFNDAVPGGMTERPPRVTGRFAGLPMAQLALRFARTRHAGQYREIDHAPFIEHAIEVGGLLRRDGQSDEVIAAGLLHDVLEKTATTAAELQDRFGPQIARLVESVSDDPSIIDQSSRKRELRDRVSRADARTLAVFAADKVAKVRELVLLPASQLDEPKNRAKLVHYRASRKMLHRVAPELALLGQLDAELDRLVAPTVTARSRTVGARTKPPNKPRRQNRSFAT
jgi:(p)ppGpp synthase/HD superfamily hydrolase